MTVRTPTTRASSVVADAETLRALPVPLECDELGAIRQFTDPDSVNQIALAHIDQLTAQLRAHVEAPHAPLRPMDAWHEDLRGVTLCWPVTPEPPYCGTPLDSDYPGDAAFLGFTLVPEPAAWRAALYTTLSHPEPAANPLPTTSVTAPHGPTT